MQQMIIDEYILQEIWQKQVFNNRDLISEDGEKLQIEFPGVPNRSEGPDFINASIIANGKRINGDIEIHLFSRDFARHGHIYDPAYSNLALHVTLWREFDKEESFRMPIRELVLEPYLTSSILEIVKYLKGDVVSRWRESPDGGCLGSSLDSETLGKILEVAGERRFDKKCEQIKLLLSKLEPEEVLYRLILTGLGYKRNKDEFYQLGKVLSYSRLKGCKDAKEIEKIFFEVANKFSFRKWGRPQNYPFKRLKGFVIFLARVSANGLLSYFRERIDNLLDRENLQLFVNNLVEDIYVSGFLGKERWKIIVFNSILPFFEVFNTATYKDIVRGIYRISPPLEGNSITRYMAKRIFYCDRDSGKRALLDSSIRRQMGLIYIYKTWCGQGRSNCEGCIFVMQ